MLEVSVTSVERIDGLVSVMFSDGAQMVVSPDSPGASMDVPYILRSALLMIGSSTSYEAIVGLRVVYNPESLQLVEVIQ
jgi:hypothetical protein